MPEKRTEHIDEDGNLVSTIDGWYEVVAKDAEGDPHVFKLNKHSTKTRPAAVVDEESFIRQAPPKKISPTRRKRPEGDYDTIIFYGDTQHPYQNERRLRLAQIAVRELMPQAVVFLGDDTDMSMFSTYEQRPEWREDTQKGIDQFSDLLAQTRADIGKNGNIYAIQGNHDLRLEREVRKYNAELLGLRRANAERELGVLTLEYLLRCDEIGVEYISGYPSAELWLGDSLKAYHGRKTNPGATVNAEVKYETVNFVHGHDHRGAIVYRTYQDGRDLKTIWGMQVGAFADQTKIPSGAYSTTESGRQLRQAQNWNSNLGVVFAPHDKEETYHAHLLDVDDESINIFGKEYKS